MAAKKDNIWKNIRNIQGSTFGDNDFSDFYSFIFEVAVEKIVIDEEELHGIEIDGILNLENLSRTVFIDEECWNLKVVVDVGELTRNITKKKKPDVLQAYKCPLCDTCYR